MVENKTRGEEEDKKELTNSAQTYGSEEEILSMKIGEDFVRETAEI